MKIEWTGGIINLDKIIAGLDIGTTKTCVVIARVKENDGIEIIGTGHCESSGLQKGVIINIDLTVKAIKKAVEEAEMMAGLNVEKLYTGIAGSHVESLNSKGVIAVSGKSGESEISREDIYRVIETAQSISIAPDRKILHVIPQEFIVDDQEGIMDPLGMSGVRLEVEVHLVTVAKAALSNIKRAVERAGYEVADIILQPIASAEAILNQDEKELGSVVIDIGGGTTDVLMYIANSIWYSHVLAVGGNNVTKDIAYGIRTPNVSAEMIKKEHGNALASKVKSTEYVKIPLVGGREPVNISMKMLAEIIEPRMKEIFTMVHDAIEKTGYLEKTAAGVILTGGGSLCKGTDALAERVLNQPVRMGKPSGLSGLSENVENPSYSTSVGLVKFAVNQYENYKVETEKGFLMRLITFIKGFF